MRHSVLFGVRVQNRNSIQNRSKSHNANFFYAPLERIQVTESLILNNLEINRFCAKLRVQKRFRI